MTGYCCVLNYYRKVSPLEGSKNRDSLLRKLVCVCGGGTRCGWMCIHVSVCVCVCRWVGMYSLLKKLVCVCVCVCVGGVECACIWVCVGV